MELTDLVRGQDDSRKRSAVRHGHAQEINRRPVNPVIPGSSRMAMVRNRCDVERATPGRLGIRNSTRPEVGDRNAFAAGITRMTCARIG